MAETLVREPISFEGDQHELDQLYAFEQLAMTAADTLGYKESLTQLPKLLEDAEKRVSLKKAMTELGIETFSAKAVERYQSKSARRATPLISKAIAWVLTIAVLLFCGAGVTFIISLVACIVCGMAEDLTVPTWLAVITWTSLGVAVANFVGIGVTDGKKLTYAEWAPIPIGEYTRPIPEFALQTAVDLKAKCPEAKFFIEELQLKERTLDPFLVVHDSQGNKHYLEVWNEPGFIQKRQR